jgi:hypothetical protein
MSKFPTIAPTNQKLLVMKMQAYVTIFFGSYFKSQSSNQDIATILGKVAVEYFWESGAISH